MANAEHLNILKEGVEVWNAWRKQNLDVLIDLSEVDLPGANLVGALLFNVDLSFANLSGTNLYAAVLDGANLQKVDLSKSSLQGAKLSEVNLHGADLSDTLLFEAKLSSSNISFVDMRRANLSRAILEKANLSGSYLGSVDLSEANLIQANLKTATMEDAILNRANLYNSNLSEANLVGASLLGANLNSAFLRQTNFRKASLYEANLSQSQLIETNFNGCQLGHTIFGFNNLSTCKNLDSVDVHAPCSIDFQTLQASKNLPKSFLLKIGLPENYIDYLPDFYENDGIRYYPAFLSHSWANKPFARKLYEALIARGVNVFFDEKKMKPGDDIFTGISRGIELYDKTILICSEDSLNSWWVDQELELVFEKERKLQKETGEKTGLLIPIKIDDHIDTWPNGKRMAIKQRIIGDFRNWQDETAFNQALDSLIQALHADRPEIKPLSHLPRKPH